VAVATRKISITVDEKLVDELKARVGERGVSRFVSDAIAEAIDREDERAWLGELLGRLEAELGPPDPELVAEASAMFDRVQAARRPRKKRSA
jgi:post-segregation antitoxin (ccd killing protein)